MFVKEQVKRKCNFVFHGQNIGNLSAVPLNSAMKAMEDQKKEAFAFLEFRINVQVTFEP